MLERPSPHFAPFSADDLPIDCTAVPPGQVVGWPCVEITPVGTGTITGERASDGTSVTISVTDGTPRRLAFNRITAFGGAVTGVVVAW